MDFHPIYKPDPNMTNCRGESKGVLFRVLKTPIRASFLAFLLSLTVPLFLIWNLLMLPQPFQNFQDSGKFKERHQPPATAAAISLPPPYMNQMMLNYDHDIQSDDYSQLVDIKDFDFIINNHLCNKTFESHNSSKLDLIVLIHSAPTNWEKRQVIRETWGSWANISGNRTRMKVIFVLGAVLHESVQDRIYEENNRNKDILQGRFLDTYRNLTYKHVMALKWVSYFCPKTTYLLKTDDDVFVNIPALVNLLTESCHDTLLKQHNKRFILCSRIDNARVVRSYRSKWHVSPKEYPEKYYPTYCSGCAILYSPEVIEQLYRRAQRMHYFWVDDVHVSGVLAAQVDVIPINLGNLILTEYKAKNLISKYLDKNENNWSEVWCEDQSQVLGKLEQFVVVRELDSSVMRNLWKLVNGNV